MKSMTGYGTSKLQSSSFSLEASVRAVNGRFLEIRFHLPKEYLPFEAELKKILQRYFERGTIDLFVGRKETAAVSEKKVRLNKKLALQYSEAFKELAKTLKVNPNLHVEAVARFPDVLMVDQDFPVSVKEKQALVKCVEAAVSACEAERKREGISIRKDLDVLIAQMEGQVALIRKYREGVNQQLQEKFSAKIRSRLEGVEIDEQRLAQEVVLQIDKSDINEELNRLAEHLQHYRTIFREQGGIGKKLDFYTQELLREVNTIGSKSNVSHLTVSVVEAKSIIEKLREQVQNLE